VSSPEPPLFPLTSESNDRRLLRCRRWRRLGARDHRREIDFRKGLSPEPPFKKAPLSPGGAKVLWGGMTWATVCKAVTADRPDCRTGPHQKRAAAEFVATGIRR
jgi:hypothetical protein